MQSQVLLLLDLMYKQLETKKALTYRIKSLYGNIKENYSDQVLSDLDDAVKKKFTCIQEVSKHV